MRYVEEKAMQDLNDAMKNADCKNRAFEFIFGQTPRQELESQEIEAIKKED